jgi:hypothetical protein
MQRATSILAAAALAACATLAVAADTGVTGKWKMTTKSPRGERTQEISLEQKGEALTVTSKDREGNDVKSEGSVKGADVTWTTKRTGPMGEMVIVYKGKIDGNKMSGTVAFGEMGSGDWTAERAE